VAPVTADGSRYRWRRGELVLEVDAAIGARVTACALGEANLLIGPEVNELNFGSTFWTSPQAQWGWPPEREVDSDRYAVSGAGTELAFVGRPGGALGIAVSKRFVVEARDDGDGGGDGNGGGFTAHYTMENRSDRARTVAPWEISRHPPGGLTFFPLGGGGILPPTSLGVRQVGGLAWFAYDAAAITDHQKLFADGAEGWIAHVDVGRRLMLVKCYPDVPRERQAPGEAEIEVYADPRHSYVEVEEQGPYEALAPGARSTWSVTWRLRRLPAGVSAAAGDARLVALARALASGHGE